MEEKEKKLCIDQSQLDKIAQNIRDRHSTWDFSDEQLKRAAETCCNISKSDSIDLAEIEKCIEEMVKQFRLIDYKPETK